MRIIRARNVHEALPLGLALLKEIGYERPSRDGKVLVSPVPVVTIYSHPWEKVLFWRYRDANPFLHLYESLWMLAGRNDIEPLVRYAKKFADLTDDGVTQHAAYGHRWRNHFGMDQIGIIVDRLRTNGNDRRCVLQMWDPRSDLRTDDKLKDVPCNTTITFQMGVRDDLEMTVFCRSNDIVWGAYGANAVHMAFLQEYIATRLHVRIGEYRQISVNYHAYVDRASESLWTLAALPSQGTNPYDFEVRATPSVDYYYPSVLCRHADLGEVLSGPDAPVWARVMSTVLHAHHLYRTLPVPDRYQSPVRLLDELRRETEVRWDWAVAAKEWLQRRYENFLNKERG